MEAWKLYLKCEPWGFEALNWHAAQIRAQQINCTPRGDKAKAVKPEQLYMPRPYP